MLYLQPQLPELVAPLVVSHSEAESAARCGFQHQLGYRERWSRPQNPDSAAGQGVAWHEVLEAHYKVIQQHQQAAENSGHPWWTFDQEWALEEARIEVQSIIDRLTEASESLGELISWMYAGYVAYWGADPDWRIVDVERAGKVPLNPPVSKDYSSLFGKIHEFDNSDASEDFMFKYRADLIIEENGRLWLVDHKSCFNFPSQMDMDFDSQVDRYTWALREEGVLIYGQLFSQARRRMLKTPQALDQRHRRPRTYRTPKELDVIAADLFRTVYARYADQLGLEQYARHPETAPRDAARQMSSRHCSHLCDLTEACLAGRKGNDSRQFLAEEGFRQDFTRH